MTNQQIVQIFSDGEARASTDAIADGYNLQHANVIKLVRKYQGEIEGFGGVGFENRSFETNGGIQTREVALLNERQTMLLLTLMRNSLKVVAFKVQLIQEFCRISEALHNRDLTIWDKRLRFEAKDEASRSLGSHGSRLIEEVEQPLFLN